ncbi:MAG TPA: hypothetical protein VKE94_15615 [Gemmataceae bacterium]|nr:hypothetical protein [Gemmataceae bacterium]
MRRPILLALAAFVCTCGGSIQSQEKADPLDRQRKAARDNWASLEAGAGASHETDHLLIQAPKTMDRRLKEIGGNLEKSYGLAVKALQIDKDQAWPGKLTVYLLPQREQLATFVRRVESRRLEDEESGSHGGEKDLPHAAASAARAKTDLALEHQAAAQVAAALLQRKAGDKVPLPDWLVLGFGRATAWRAAPADKSLLDERRLAKALIAGKKHAAADVWDGTLEAEEAGVLRASLGEFLAYGPGAAKFPAIARGFKPGENQDSRTFLQALESAGLDPKAIEARWGPWAVAGGK